MPERETMDEEAEAVEQTQEGAPEAEEQQSGGNAEAEAREMGWRPKEDFKGDPDRWVDAAEFIRRGNEFLPIVRSKLERSEARVQELETKFEREISGLKKMSARALEQQRKQLTDRFEEEKRKAVELGDTEAYDKANKAQQDALKDLTKEAKEAAEEDGDELGDKSGLSKRDKATLDGWLAENTWFKSSRLLTAAADDHWDALDRESPGMAFAEKLEEVKRRVAEDFPDKFGKKAAPKPSAVEGSSRVGSNGTGASLFSRLPAEAKAQADEFIKQHGLFLEKGETAEKNLSAARERYAKSYAEENAQ